MSYLCPVSSKWLNYKQELYRSVLKCNVRNAHFNQKVATICKSLQIDCQCLSFLLVWSRTSWSCIMHHRLVLIMLIRPLKINCAFWVTSLVPLALSGRKTRALYFMFTVGQQIFVCRKFSRTSAKYLRKLCVFFTAHVFLPRSLVAFQKIPDSKRTIYFKRP